jgi:hypothetical protein
MRKLLTRLAITLFLLMVLLQVCAAAMGQVVGLQPTPMAGYTWDTSTNVWDPIPTTDTANPSQNTPQAFAQYRWNATLGQWVPCQTGEDCSGGGVTSVMPSSSVSCTPLIDGVCVGSITLTAAGGVTFQHNGMDLVLQNLLNFNDTTPAAPSGYVNGIWQSDAEGDLAVYVPSTATPDLQMLVVPPTTGQYVLVLPATSVSSGIAGDAVVDLGPSSGKILFSSHGGSCFGVNACSATITWSGFALPSYVSPANVTSVVPVVISGLGALTPQAGGLVGGNAIVFSPGSGSPTLSINAYGIKQSNGSGSTMTGAQVSSATAAWTLASSGGSGIPVTLNVPLVGLLVYYTGTAPPANSALNLTVPLYINPSTNSMGVGPINLAIGSDGGVVGTLPITSGGTGATNYNAALSNLLNNPAAGNYTINCTSTSSCTSGAAGTSGFPFTLGSTSIAAGSTNTTLNGLTLGSSTFNGADISFAVNISANWLWISDANISGSGKDREAVGPSSRAFNEGQVCVGPSTCQNNTTSTANNYTNAFGLGTFNTSNTCLRCNFFGDAAGITATGLTDVHIFGDTTLGISNAAAFGDSTVTNTYLWGNLNIGALTADPSSPSNGNLWYNSTSNQLKAQINGATVPLGTGGTVTSFSAPSGSWPSWLVPTVTNSTTTPSLAVAASAIPNSALATQTANTVLGALTATSPSGLTMPSCSGATSALIWTSGTGFGCNNVFLGKNQSTTTYTNATGTPSTIWSFPVAASTNYYIHCEGVYKAASGGAFELTVTGPSSPTNVSYSFRPTVALSSAAPTDLVYASTGSSYPSALNATAITTAATDMPFTLDFNLNNGTTAGTLAIQGNTISTDTLTVEIGSTCTIN